MHDIRLSGPVPAQADGRTGTRAGRLRRHGNWDAVHDAPMRKPDPRRVTNTAATRPLDALWQARVVMWVVLAGEGLALVLALSYAGDKARWTYFGIASLAIQWVSLLTLGTLYGLRHRLAGLPAQRIAWLTLATFVLSALVVSAAAWIALGDSWLSEGDDWRLVALRLAGIALIVGLLGLAAFQNHWNARRAAVRAKQAELEALQARIRPHFLFNTLNTATALVHQQPQRAEGLLMDLADLFRAALAGPRQILLAEELSLVRRYLDIELLRFGDRLRVEWELPSEIPRVDVPSLSIQPLVENAIRHGVERVERGGRVEITVSTTREHVLVRVRNALVLGSPMNPSHKVGLSAARARIEAMTDGRGSVETSIQGEHHVAIVRLPRPGETSWR